MKIRNEIEELNAKFEHLQYRFDNLRDYVKENPPSDYYWNRFEDLLAWSLKFESGLGKKSSSPAFGSVVLRLGREKDFNYKRLIQHIILS